MTGLAAGYAIGIVGDAVSLELDTPINQSPMCLLPFTVCPSVSLRIKNLRVDGVDPDFRVSDNLIAREKGFWADTAHMR